jgi:hypothetical protein
MTTIKAIWFFLTNWPTLKAWLEKAREFLKRVE